MAGPEAGRLRPVPARDAKPAIARRGFLSRVPHRSRRPARDGLRCRLGLRVRWAAAFAASHRPAAEIACASFTSAARRASDQQDAGARSAAREQCPGLLVTVRLAPSSLELHGDRPVVVRPAFGLEDGLPLPRILYLQPALLSFFLAFFTVRPRSFGTLHFFFVGSRWRRRRGRQRSLHDTARVRGRDAADLVAGETR